MLHPAAREPEERNHDHSLRHHIKTAPWVTSRQRGVVNA